MSLIVLLHLIWANLDVDPKIEIWLKFDIIIEKVKIVKLVQFL